LQHLLSAQKSEAGCGAIATVAASGASDHTVALENCVSGASGPHGCGRCGKRKSDDDFFHVDLI